MHAVNLDVGVCTAESHVSSAGEKDKDDSVSDSGMALANSLHQVKRIDMLPRSTFGQWVILDKVGHRVSCLTSDLGMHGSWETTHD